MRYLVRVINPETGHAADFQADEPNPTAATRAGLDGYTGLLGNFEERQKLLAVVVLPETALHLLPLEITTPGELPA